MALQLCSNFFNVCFQIAAQLAAPAAQFSSLYQQSTYQFQHLIEDLDSAYAMLLQFRALLHTLEALQDRYKLRVCSLSRATKFAEGFEKFLGSIQKEGAGIVAKAMERAFAQWYRDELRSYVAYMSGFSHYLMADLALVQNEVRLLDQLRGKAKEKKRQEIQSVLECKGGLARAQKDNILIQCGEENCVAVPERKRPRMLV